MARPPRSDRGGLRHELLLCRIHAITSAIAGSAVGFSAVFYRGDANRNSVVMKADAIVAHSQPELRRFDVLETFDIAFAGVKITSQRLEDTEGGGLIDGAKLSFGLVVPNNDLTGAYRTGLGELSGVRPMSAKSSKVSPNSARTFS